MKLIINKLNDEKLEIKVQDENNLHFHNSIYYTYMGEIIYDNDKINDIIDQMKKVFEISEIENNFGI